MFKVEIIGNLGADAVVKEANGSKFITMRIASTYKVDKGDGNKVEVTDWIDATLSDAEAKILPFLRQGVKVYVRGTGALRVYSSPKDRCMKAGCTVRISEIELCGGQVDDVPRQLIVPDSGQLVDITKHYWANLETSKMKNDDVLELIDQKGKAYVMNKGGFVVPSQEEPQGEESKS